MPQVCPRPCGRLATAAVLISVGVVQLVAGLILVRSKYVYLLSAPNFWTAASNFAVGGLLGMSASVWKETQKVSPKHTTRRNLLASLVMSSLLMNGTTAAILVLGEGNALLSIKLESSGIYSNATLASELLAYAFASSVCSPIICIVVMCIFLSGLCFRRLEKNTEMTKNKKISNEDDAYAYSWVFRPRLGHLSHPNSTNIRRALSTRFLSSSTDDDDSPSSPDTVLHRSNSLPSEDGSLLYASRRERARSDSNMFQLARHEPNTADTEQMNPPRDRNKVSFVDESLKGGRSLPRHFEAGRRSNQKFFKARSNDAVFESSSKYPMSMRKIQPKLLVKGLSGVELTRRLELDHYRERSPEVADVHIRTPENDKVYVPYNNSAEESTLIYEADSFSGDVFIRFGNDDPPYIKSKIRRTSTERNLKSLEAMDSTQDGHKSVRRTSTAIDLKSPDEFEIMEDSKCKVSNFGQTESSRTLNKTPCNEVSYSSGRFPKESDIVDYLNTGTSQLAGEMVPIQVSTLPRKLSSNLIPVAIPVVPGTRKYSLKAAKSSDIRYLKYKHENHRRVSSVARTSKFHGVGEPKLVSFCGGIKTNAKKNRSHKTMMFPEKQAVTRTYPASPEPIPQQHPENEARGNGCCSPAHTSGYMSALEDTLDSSGKTIVSPSTSVAGSSICQPHHRLMSDGRNSQYARSSLECNTEKDALNRIDCESFAMSKEKLIDQLLNDPSFQKIMIQTLKETRI